MTESDTPKNGPIEVRLQGIRKSFAGVEVLHGIALDVQGGEVVALLGENGAGKSTTIKILSGEYPAEAGTIWVDGVVADLRGPRDAHELGIRVIHQEFNDAPDLTVAENLHLGELVATRGIVRWSRVRRNAKEALARIGVDIDVDTAVGTLGVAQRQVVEIVRALMRRARLLILDEPTSALSDTEANRLFDLIRSLRADGVAIVYITHRLDELEAIADRVAVFRDGDVVLPATPFCDLSRGDIVAAMVGDAGVGSAGAVYESTRGQGDVVLTLDGVDVGDDVRDVGFEVRAGQITVLFGRVGCGTLELAQAIFGLRKVTGGSISIRGRIAPTSPRRAIASGVGYVSPDRKKRGLLTGLGAAENLTVASWPRVAQRGVLAPQRLRRIFDRWSSELDIAAVGGPRQRIETLSGGNQQKVILGRWLERNAEILVLVEPTRGVDVRARTEIYHQIETAVSKGTAAVVVSSDVDEVIRLAGQVHVVVAGSIVETFINGAELSRAVLVEAAGKSEAAVRC